MSEISREEVRRRAAEAQARREKERAALRQKQREAMKRQQEADNRAAKREAERAAMKNGFSKAGLSSSNPFSDENLVAGLMGQDSKIGARILNSLNIGSITTTQKYTSTLTDKYSEESVNFPANWDIQFVQLSTKDWNNLNYGLSKKPPLRIFFSSGEGFIISPYDLKNLVDAQKRAGVDIKLTVQANNLQSTQRTKSVRIIVQNPRAL